jgi:bacteriocin biosynthesis cyclodehydratase domain-containing protein
MSLLAPGHHLYPADDGAWRYSAPFDRFVRVTGDSATLAAFQRLVHGGVEPDLGTMAAVDSEAFAQLSEMFAARELLDHDAPAVLSTAPERPDRATALVAIEGGDTPLGRAVTRLLEQAARVVQGPADEDAVRAADLVVSCAGWLPDTHWQELDRWCATHRTPWHRLHVEDSRFFLGPLTVPGETACYRDLRGRRLAASPVADELLRHWSYLEDPDQLRPAVPWPAEAGLAMLAGLVAHDVLTYLRTGTPAVVDAELEVDLAAMSITHHRVLPLPATSAR